MKAIVICHSLYAQTAVCYLEARHRFDLEAFFMTEGADVATEMEAAFATLNTLVDKDRGQGQHAERAKLVRFCFIFLFHRARIDTQGFMLCRSTSYNDSTKLDWIFSLCRANCCTRTKLPLRVFVAYSGIRSIFLAYLLVKANTVKLQKEMGS